MSSSLTRRAMTKVSPVAQWPRAVYSLAAVQRVNDVSTALTVGSVYAPYAARVRIPPGVALVVIPDWWESAVSARLTRGVCRTRVSRGRGLAQPQGAR